MGFSPLIIDDGQIKSSTVDDQVFLNATTIAIIVAYYAVVFLLWPLYLLRAKMS